MATCMSSRASPATQPAGSGSNGFGPSSSFVLSIDMFDAAKSWQQQQQQQRPHPASKRATFTAVKKPANAAPLGGISAQNSAEGIASTSAAASAGAGNSSSFHLGILSSGGERICPIPCVDWREAARKAEETRMLASEVCPIPAQNWRKDAPRAETRNSTLSSTPAAAAATAAKRGAPGTGSASASAREDKTESSCDSTTRKKKQQPLVQRGNPTAAGHHKAALSVTIEEASSEDSSADFPARFETESKPVTLGEASLSSVPPFRVGVFSAQSHLRENAPFGSASPATSPTPSACSARSSVISTFSLARRSSFSSSASSSVASGGSSSSGGGGGGGGGHGDFTPPISSCSTLLGSASSTIDENDVPSFAARKDRDTTPSHLLSSRPKSPRQSPADYHGDEDGGAAISRVCTAPSVADSSRSRPPRLVMERLRLGLPNRTSSLPLRGLDSPTASPANSPAANDTSGTTGMARTRMSGHSVPKCSSLASDPAPAGLHSPVSRTTWEHMRRRTVAATGVKEQGGEDLQMDGEEMRQQQHWPEEEGMGETECKSQFLAESACLNWEDVEELCHRMDIAGIRIETLDIQPVDDDNHPPSHAAKVHTGTTSTAAAAAACNALVGHSGPVSVGKDMTRFSGEESCASAASVVALKFSGMHMWYYPGDNVKPLFRDAVQW